MRVHVTHKTEFDVKTAASWLAFPIFEDAPGLCSDMLSRSDALSFRKLSQSSVLSGKAEQVLALPTPKGAYQGALALGVGKRESFGPESLRRAAGAACKTLGQHRVRSLVFDASPCGDEVATPFIEGILLGQYRFDRYKADQDPDHPPVVVGDICLLTGSAGSVGAEQERCDHALVTCRSTNWARDLANAPSNDLSPSRLAETARAVAEEGNCSCTVLDEEEMGRMGMGALLGVAQGSAAPPRLICLAYIGGTHTKTLAIVGKGITFDTGGISLKPHENMHEMKYDMCGAAAVLGAMKTICELRPRVNVICVVPAAENMPGPKAQRPGDIVRAYNGKTIEVHNTDAEGRMVLADALAYTVDEYQPDYIVDLATLTGTCVMALGHYAAGLMTNNDDLGARIQRAADQSGERVWPLPLWKDYHKLIEGTHADLCNIGPGREAAPITGGCFLQAFVGDTPWAHLDIAGTAWGAKHISYLDPKQASGYGVRLLTQLLLNEADAVSEQLA